MRGSRVQAVVNELQGEKIDIIPWSPDAATFIVNALQPAEVVKVVLDEDSSRIEVVVPDDQLSLAIGRRGQNVRLASQLTGWDIDILTEAEESERRQKEFSSARTPSCRRSTLTKSSASCLPRKAFARSRNWPSSTLREVAAIEGFDEETAQEIQIPRAKLSGSDRSAAGRAPARAWRFRRSEGNRRRHHRDAGQVRRERREECRGSCRMRD